MFLGYNKHHTMIRLLFGGSKKHNTYKLVILFRFYSFYKVDTRHNNIIHIYYMPEILFDFDIYLTIIQ